MVPHSGFEQQFQGKLKHRRTRAHPRLQASGLYTSLVSKDRKNSRRVKLYPRERPANYVVTKMVAEEIGREEVGRRDPLLLLGGG